MVTITSMRTSEDAAAFRRLNEEWISSLFTLEDKDRDTLADPFGHFVEPGGDVLLARDSEEGVVGCVALEPTGNGVFELSKMAVSPSQRGRGIGRRLAVAAIDRARALGASSLFLGSNRRLAAAVGLYESLGFQHVSRERVGPLPYTRANVFMQLTLDEGRRRGQWPSATPYRPGGLDRARGLVEPEHDRTGALPSVGCGRS